MCLYIFLEEGFHSFPQILKRVHNPQRTKNLSYFHGPKARKIAYA